MFYHLRQHPTILVTGPARSGTRICAKIITHNTGHRYIDEAEFGINRINKLSKIIAKESNIVVHCPALAYCIDNFQNAFIVIVKREVKEIVKSQERIGGGKFSRSFYKYPREYRPKDVNSPSAWPTVVYKYWNEVQKKKLKGFLEVEYKSLSTHPLWIPKEKRLNFKPAQTSLSQ